MKEEKENDKKKSPGHLSCIDGDHFFLCFV